MWQRRIDLHGSVIRWTFIKYPILSPQFIYDENENVIDGKGFLMDMMYLLQKELNFTVVLSESIDKKFGAKTENGSFNGMVGMLVRNETDIVNAHLVVTQERSEVIDYTITWKFSVCSLIAPVDRAHSHNHLVFMKVWKRHWLVWGLIATGVLVFAAAFYVIGNFGTRNFHDSSHSDSFGWLQSGALSMTLLMQLTYRVSIESNAARIALMSASTCAYVLFSIWSADITAGMTTGPRTVPIRNFQDIIDNGYRVITRPSTVNSYLLRTATEGTPMRQVWNEIKDDPSHFYIKISEALDIISKDSKALFWAPETNILGNHDYEYLRLEDAVYTQAGWGVQPNSEFTELLNYWLATLDENGMKHNMMRDWTYKAMDKFWIDDAAELGFQHIAFPFLLLGGGVTLAITMFVYEKKKMKPKRVKRRNIKAMKINMCRAKVQLSQ